MFKWKYLPTSVPEIVMNKNISNIHVFTYLYLQINYTKYVWMDDGLTTCFLILVTPHSYIINVYPLFEIIFK